MTLDDVLKLLDNVHRSGSGFSARCPAHQDRNNSLSVDEGDDGRVLIRCHAGCDVEEVVEAVGLEKSDLFIKKAKSKSRGKTLGLTLTDYAEAKRLPEKFLADVGLSTIWVLQEQVVRIPYLPEPNGEPTAVRFRHSIDGDKKFSWRTKPKSLLGLYGLWLLEEFRESSNYVVLVEGESDCHTLWFTGFPALGIPGANNWKDDRDSVHLDDFEDIYLVVEADGGGQTLAKAISSSRIRDRVKAIRLRNAKDASELYLSGPDDFVTKFEAAMADAVPLNDVDEEARRLQRDEAWRSCANLASKPNILDVFAADLKKAGVVGEENNAKLLYLVVTSRLLDKPVSAVVKGPSSGGKSYVTDQVCRFFPADATYKLTAASEKALIYSEEPLKHRVIVMAEAGGVQGDVGALIVRSLLSEGRINYETVDKTSKGGLQHRRIEREGPTGLISTTTRISLDKELETRLLSLFVDDTVKHTREVMKSLAKDTAPIDLERWHSLQTWLAAGRCDVVIHYAEPLALQTNPAIVSMRRAFSSVLGLIKAHALLHQASRDKDNEGRVIASFADYIAVWRAVGDVLSIAAGLKVKSETRETVKAVVELLDEDHAQTVNQARLAKHMGLDKSTVSRRVRDALATDFLEDLNESSRSSAYNLVPGQPLPEDTSALPSPHVFEPWCDIAGCECDEVA